MRGRTHPPYPPEFRAEAVELVRSSTRSVPDIARDLGISDQALRNWVKHAAIEAGQDAAGAVSRSEREELHQLRRENQALRMEREILKKAAAFFAKEIR